MAFFSSKRTQTLNLMTFAYIFLSSINSLADWSSDIKFTGKRGSEEYSDGVRTGAKTGGGRNYSASTDLLDPPNTPKGINVFLEPDEGSNYLSSKFISPSDKNRSFRGVIETNQFAPTNITATVTSLPSDYHGTIMTFSDANYATNTSLTNMINGREVNLPQATRSFIFTEIPKASLIVSSNKIRLEGEVYSYGKIKSLGVESSTNISAPYSNRSLGLNPDSLRPGIYTNTYPKINREYFRLKVGKQ